MEKVLNLIMWIVGVLVSLAVGFGMIDETLTLPSYLYVQPIVPIAGWIVVIGTIIGVVMAIIKATK